MKDRPAWNLRGLMALWNLSLSVFSWVGMFRTLPQLLHNLYYSSLRDNLCLDREYFFLSLSSDGSWHSERTWIRIHSWSCHLMRCELGDFNNSYPFHEWYLTPFLFSDFDHYLVIRIAARVTYGSGSSGLWVQLFVLSKFP